MSRFFIKHWFLIALVLAVGSTMLIPESIRPATEHFSPTWTVALSLFLISLTLPSESLVQEFRQPFASMWAILLSYGLVPFGAWFIGHVVAIDDVKVGLVLVSSVPCTLASAIIWTRLAGGNEATAILAVSGTILISWCATPALLAAFTDGAVDQEFLSVMLDLILWSIVPMILGQAVRYVPGCARIADRWKVILGILAQSLVVAI